MSKSRPRKPRTPNRFRERELARVVRAAKRGGGSRVKLDPETGIYTVFIGDKPAEHVADNEVENWLSRQARPT